VQSEDPRAFHGHDFFILSAQPDGRFVLIGIHQRIVTDAFERYGRTADRDDPATRRAVARWLYTSPTMRASLARPGPPYAFEAVVSDAGMLHSLTAFYHWGQVATGGQGVEAGQPAAVGGTETRGPDQPLLDQAYRPTRRAPPAAERPAPRPPGRRTRRAPADPG